MIDDLALRMAIWREDPSLYVRERFGVVPDAWQERALRAFPRMVADDPTSMREALLACVGVGKDAYFAWCGLNVLECYGSATEHPQVVCLGATEKALHDTLWKEYARWYNAPGAAQLRAWFTMTTERIASREFPLLRFISARSYPKDADASTISSALSGVHAPIVLVQFSECAEMPVGLINTAEQARSGAKWWKLQVNGNPTFRDGVLGHATLREPARWTVYRITGDPKDPDRSPRIPIEMAREALEDPLRGPSDPWVMAHILGRFPPGGINTLIEPDQVLEAMKRAPKEPDFAWAPKVIGVDVGRQGLDPSVVARRQGNMLWQLEARHGIDGHEGAGWVARTWQDWKAQACFIDDTGGFGGSWLDQLRNGLDFSPVGIHFAGEPADKRYLNKRAEMIFAFVNWIKEGGALPNDPDLLRELCALRYMHKGDRMKIEEKDEIRKRLGHSTDRVDACALTFAMPVAVSRGEPGTEWYRAQGGAQVAVMETAEDMLGLKGRW